MFKALIVSLWLTNAADTASSLVAFKGGAHEMNPFIISEQPAPFIAQVAIATAAETWIASKLHTKRPKLTKVLLSVAIAGGTAATINNINVIREQRRR